MLFSFGLVNCNWVMGEIQMWAKQTMFFCKTNNVDCMVPDVSQNQRQRFTNVFVQSRLFWNLQREEDSLRWTLCKSIIMFLVQGYERMFLRHNWIISFAHQNFTVLVHFCCFSSFNPAPCIWLVRYSMINYWHYLTNLNISPYIYVSFQYIRIGYPNLKIEYHFQHQFLQWKKYLSTSCRSG